MKQAATRELFSYWDSLRGERTAPERAEIDPAAIRGLLRDTFILSVDAQRAYPIRVSGARFNALFVRELKGFSFLDLWREEDLECIESLIDSVVDDPTPLVAGAAATAGGRDPLDLELLLLPLRHHGRTHARILGSLTPSFTPTWLGLIEAEPLRLSSLRIIRPDTQSEPMEEPEPPTPHAMTLMRGPAGDLSSAFSHLRLVQGGRRG